MTIVCDFSDAASAKQYTHLQRAVHVGEEVSGGVVVLLVRREAWEAVARRGGSRCALEHLLRGDGRETKQSS